MRSRYVLAAGLVLACDRNAKPTGARATDTALMRAESAAPSTAALPARTVPHLRFEDYAAADTALRRRRPAAVDLASAAYGRMYRTKLREGAAAGPNFAGHYTVVLWGCGTGCQVVAVVDARTGRLSKETLLTANGVQFRRDSRLLHADPRTPELLPDCASCGTPAFYEWRDRRFVPVGPGPHPHLGGPRPWRTECGPSDTVPAIGLYTCPDRTSR
ncbi:MAG: hypothetical protein M3282_13390 [Gemmatimonadota bacterium]|nr:hypothetical protein [Gemmatimonadota bacterium]